MRHPHPILYVIGLASPLVIGLCNALSFVHSRPAGASVPKTVLLTVLVAALPMLSLMALCLLGGCVLIYLSAYRPGNRVRIAAGPDCGKTAIITRREDASSNGMLHVRIDGTDGESQVPYYRCRKTGWKSFVF
jgi:hypothetical protein